MSLKVIGVGFSRTGTHALKFALEELGFVKCHHMIEVVAHPDQAPVFLAAALKKRTGEGEPIDWDALFDGYQACCDFPSCYFWRELTSHYPDAKVVLSIRSSESWYRSINETIFPSLRETMAAFDNPLVEIGRDIILNRAFGGNIDDKEHVIGVYERHNQAIRDAIPAERLLEFEAKQGWEPLCEFLGVPVPDEPYPRTNALEEFQQIAASLKEQMAEGEA